MPKFSIKTTVDYFFEGDFDTAEEAEQFGWQFDEMVYDGVFDIVVEQLSDDEEEA